MKKVNNITKLIASLFIVGLTFSSMASAQTRDGLHANLDWQLNLPLNNGFADRFSGWGLNFDGGYYVTDNISVGLFLSYHTNQEYIPRQTLNLSETSSLTTDQKHSLFQLPFGASMRYSFLPDNKLQPYLGLKLGANYARTSTSMNIFEISRDSWGFHISPEVGANIYVDPLNRFGIHVATYYSYSTNRNNVLIYSVDGLSNWGMRLGIAF